MSAKAPSMPSSPTVPVMRAPRSRRPSAGEAEDLRDVGHRVGVAVDAALEDAREVEQLERAEGDLLLLPADADDRRRAAAAGGRPAGPDRVGQADAVEGVVGSALLGQAAHLLGQLAAASSTCVAPWSRQLELLRRAVDHDDLARAGQARALHDGQAHPAEPDDQDRLPSRTFAVLSTAPTPVMTAQPTSAACSSGTPSGTLRTARSETTVSSAKPPVDRPG
jgi:hypothetical protein